VGRARKGTVHIVDESGRECPVGAAGLVCFSGVSPFSYYKAPEKTAARTLQGGLQTFGDIGHVDADGYLYLTDRQDDMIISGGVNVYPQEIEAAIREVEGVWDCAVVGVPDERFGERPVAFVVADRAHSVAAGAETGADTDAFIIELARHCAERLGRIKQPDRFIVVEELPRSATGKLLRKRLAALFLKAQAFPAA
jgi:acyl-CoA synthetase (AMP-forming)/AMP-acid ligase II